MTATKIAAPGLVAALALGLGGGALLRPLAPPNEPSAAAPLVASVGPARLKVEDVNGTVKAFGPGKTWRRVKAGDTIERPTVLVAEGLEARVSVAQGPYRIIATHDARVVIGAGSRLSVQVDAGLALVHSQSGPIRVTVPLNQAALSGDAFGVWSMPGRLITAVLEGEVVLETAGVETRYAKGREILITPRGPLPLVASPRLQIEMQKVDKIAARTRVFGKTSPNAIVYARRNGHQEQIEIGTTGGFIVDLDTRDPDGSDLVAFDSAGRRAEIDRPSVTFDDASSALSLGARIAGAEPEPEAEGAGDEAEAKPEEGEAKPDEGEAHAAPAETKPASAEAPAEAEGHAADRKPAPAPRAADPAPAKAPSRREAREASDVPEPVKLDIPSVPAPSTEGGKKPTEKDDEGEKKDGVELKWD